MEKRLEVYETSSKCLATRSCEFGGFTMEDLQQLDQYVKQEENDEPYSHSLNNYGRSQCSTITYKLADNNKCRQSTVFCNDILQRRGLELKCLMCSQENTDVVSDLMLPCGEFHREYDSDKFGKHAKYHCKICRLSNFHNVCALSLRNFLGATMQVETDRKLLVKLQKIHDYYEKTYLQMCVLLKLNRLQCKHLIHNVSFYETIYPFNVVLEHYKLSSTKKIQETQNSLLRTKQHLLTFWRVAEIHYNMAVFIEYPCTDCQLSLPELGYDVPDLYLEIKHTSSAHYKQIVFDNFDFLLQTYLFYSFSRCSLLVAEKQKKQGLRTLSNRCKFANVVAEIINQYVIIDAIEHVQHLMFLLANLKTKAHTVLPFPYNQETSLVTTFIEHEMKRFIETNTVQQPNVSHKRHYDEEYEEE